MNFSLGEPQTFSTISGVYRLKCRFRIWNTQCGFWSVGSFSAGPGLSDRTVVERGPGALCDQVLRDRARSLRPALICPGRVVVPALESVVRPERRLGELHH